MTSLDFYLNFGIKYSMREPICDVINYRV